MHILNGQLVKADMNSNARGGTELLAERMVRDINSDLLKECQIVFSRLTFPLEADKIRLYYCHDLPGDPAAKHLENGGWKKFHRIIFVSHWQMNGFINMYGIAPSHCQVMLNSIEPIHPHEKKKEGPIRLGYWSTPHRGLEILVPVFEQLSKDHDIELDVYSSFDLYGWPERDEQYQALFQRCKDHEKINYHGAVSNEQLREGLKDIDILAYPSIWMETSCLTLMEAMSAGCIAVHSNLGALFETAANWTVMYQYREDPNEHAAAFMHSLNFAIENVRSEELQKMAVDQKRYADVFYNWEHRRTQWEMLISSFRGVDRSLPAEPGATFTYQSG